MVEQTLQPTSERKINYGQKEFLNSDDPLVDLMHLLRNVPTDTPEAKLNETTMLNSRGERVKY
jgi:hypothetical protein